MYLEPRSLILISDKAYKLLHGITEKKADKFDDNEIFVFNKPDNLKPDVSIQRTTR